MMQECALVWFDVLRVREGLCGIAGAVARRECADGTRNLETRSHAIVHLARGKATP